MPFSSLRHPCVSRNLFSRATGLKKGSAFAGMTVVGVAVLVSACSPQIDTSERTDLPTIVSLNPCTDAILGEIADPAQILAISHYSHDPRATSMPLGEARKYPAISGSVEEVLALNPDIVIAGGHVGPATVDAMMRLNIRLVQTPVANSIADSDAGIRTIARAIGQGPRGDRLIARIDAALVRNAAPKDSRSVPALVWEGGGLVPGKGTLVDEMLTRTGFENVAEARGLQQWDVLGLEYLVDRPPQVLFSSNGSRAQDDRMLGHPALAALKDRMHFAQFEPQLMFCGGPTIIRATDRLAMVRRELE